ncbi:zeta toxin family protein [Cyanobium sp. Morenito 9A2]|uniref:zeta toxin family protein n=1 Tax=Cyanobium sp. Morenito 9A2 TaxID=2823718 RepID=UPI0020CE45FC|nr:zeta toxin family protein [Cyanobium sp. Morenito 9A2]MCP9851072.1 zeta toxin family protein [Cyanobium sp. Morenito 9A2]
MLLTVPMGGAAPVAADPPPGEHCQRLNRSGRPDIQPAAIDWLERCLLGLTTTKSTYFSGSNYSPERQKLHGEIIQAALSGKPCVTMEAPVAILTGGPPGAGKTTWLRRHIRGSLLQSSYRIDADEVREALPEYHGWNASSTQAEVRDIVTMQIEAITRPCRLNVIYDGTMTQADRYEQLIGSLKQNGYQVFLVQVLIPEPLSLQRVLERYQSSGRYVPRSIVKAFYQRGMAVFRQLAPRANGSIQVDGLTGGVLWSQGDPLPGREAKPTNPIRLPMGNHQKQPAIRGQSAASEQL